MQSYLINPKFSIHICVDVRIEIDSPFPMKHSPLVRSQCSILRCMCSPDTIDLGWDQNKTFCHTLPVTMQFSNTRSELCRRRPPVIILRCAIILPQSSNPQLCSGCVLLLHTTTNYTEKTEPQMTKTLSKIKRNPPTMWRRCWIISNGWKYIGLTWTLTEVREKHCVSVSMQFSMDLCGSNHSFWSDINAEVGLDMCPHAFLAPTSLAAWISRAQRDSERSCVITHSLDSRCH